MVFGGFAFTAGLFIYGCKDARSYLDAIELIRSRRTSSPSINYWPSIIGIVLTGFGFTAIFQAALNYLVDTLTRISASAVAANTFLQLMMAGTFPLFVIPMYHGMGVGLGTTILGCIAAVLIPVPFLFFIWAKRIRAKGK